MLTYSSIVPVKTNRENLLAGRFFRIFDWGQNNRYFDSTVKTRMCYNFLRHCFVLMCTSCMISNKQLVGPAKQL